MAKASSKTLDDTQEPVTAEPDDRVTVRLGGALSRDVAADPEADIAARSGHCDAARSNRFVRVFPVATGHLGSDDEAMHARNGVAVVQEAIQQGLHPRGEVSFDGVVDQDPSEPGYDARYPVSHLTYSVECVPAGIDPDASKTTTPGAAARPASTD
jgi:hypothetical protein